MNQILMTDDFNYNNKAKKPKTNNPIDIKKIMLVSLLCCLIVCMLSSPSDYSKLTKQESKKGVVLNFGIYLYQCNDLIQSLKPQITNVLGHDKALKETREYYQQNKYKEYLSVH